MRPIEARGGPARPVIPGKGPSPTSPLSSLPRFVVPAPSEKRYVAHQLLVEMPSQLAPAAIRDMERRLGLTLISSKDIPSLATKVNRYRLAGPRTVADTVRRLRAEARVAGAQPNYVYALQEDGRPPHVFPPGSAPDAASGDSALQYAVAALHLTEAHRLATGKGVRIAVIDSGIDADNPEISGRIVARLDTLGGGFKPHAHGTGVAGAIFAHDKLVGVAPDAELIAIRAFTGEGEPNGAEATSSDIVEGLNFAEAQNARVVNMSFAGPRDVLLARTLEALRAKGIIEIAAAGNGGAGSAPLFPGAEPGVIAVTATDSGGRLFAMANRGSYIAMAAPGVDILLPAPGGAVQIASGTSIAAAHVTGIIALVIEKYGVMTQDALIALLDASTTQPLTTTLEQDYGAGLIDAYGVLRAKEGGAGLEVPTPPASTAAE